MTPGPHGGRQGCLLVVKSVACHAEGPGSITLKDTMSEAHSWCRLL